MVSESLEAAKITIISVISIIIGSLIAVSSMIIINYKDELSKSVSSLVFLWIFTLLTIWAGSMQFVCGFCLLFRRILIRRWISINAIAFLVIVLAVCILSTTFYREPSSSSGTPSCPTKDFAAVGVEYDTSNETEVVEMENFVEEEMPVLINLTTTTLEPPQNNLDGTAIIMGSKNALNFYCGSIIADFVFLPIFLGMMATRAREQFKGRNLMERVYTYPLMNN